jgi:hypothetical protein
MLLHAQLHSGAKRTNDVGFVLNAGMTRHSGKKGLAVAALVLSLASPESAAAKITEMGALPADIRPGCPVQCQALDRLTGYQAKVGPDRALYQAPGDGRIVAWSIALGRPNAHDTGIFQRDYGLLALATVVVLDAGAKLSRTVVAKAPLQVLNAYFGQTVQFPLVNTLAIKKGQYVGLTVPTWAPAMQIGLGNETSWRSSRDEKSCLATTPQFALVGRRTNAFFRCLYKGVRLTYSATFISNPTATPTK